MNVVVCCSGNDLKIIGPRWEQSKGSEVYASKYLKKFRNIFDGFRGTKDNKFIDIIEIIDQFNDHLFRFGIRFWRYFL